MNITKLVCFLCVLTVNLFVSAGALAALPDPQKLFTETIVEMSRAHIHQVGGQNLESILSKVATIKMVFVPAIVVPNQETFRGSAYWNKLTNTIYLSEYHFNRVEPKYLRWVLFHEVLGIIGIDDNNFHKSALAEAITKALALRSQNPNFIRSPETILFFVENLNASESGISGVGGGGDIRTMTYVTIIYMDLFYRVDRNLISASQASKLIQHLLKLDIEFSDGVPQGRYLYSHQELKLLIPNNPSTPANYDLNYDAVIRLIDLWLKQLE